MRRGYRLVFPLIFFFFFFSTVNALGKAMSSILVTIKTENEREIIGSDNFKIPKTALSNVESVF